MNLAKVGMAAFLLYLTLLGVFILLSILTPHTAQASTVFYDRVPTGTLINTDVGEATLDVEFQYSFELDAECAETATYVGVATGDLTSVIAPVALPVFDTDFVPLAVGTYQLNVHYFDADPSGDFSLSCASDSLDFFVIEQGEYVGGVECPWSEGISYYDAECKDPRAIYYLDFLFIAITIIFLLIVMPVFSRKT